MKIKFFYDNIYFRIRRAKEIRRFLEKVITGERKIPGDLFFIFTDDTSIIEINRKFLKHNYYTDVIAFDNSEGEIINGEIYISFDRIKKNAKEYKVTIKEEVLRVMVHGTLHLCGYDDRSDNKRKVMESRQEKLLSEFLDR